MRALDLFSGIGGFALGLQWAGFPPPVAFCERDEFCQRILAKHWPDVPIHNDVRELTADAVGPVDLICGGFPCQPWSVAGQQRGADDDRDLWHEMRRLVAAARPRWVLGENVAGLVGHPLGLDRVLADLEDLGYACQAVCIPACAVDAPHIRDRVWIVAHAEQRRSQGAEPAGPANGSGRRPADAGSEGSLAHDASGRRGLPNREVPAARSEGQAGGCGSVGGLAHAGEQRRDGRTGVERGGRQAAIGGEASGDAGNGDGVGDAAGSRTDVHATQGSPRGTTGERSGWSDAEWLWCEFDQRWRRTQPGVRLLAHGIPGRVARLRALGNAVVPQVVEQIGMAILAADRS